MTPSQFKLAIRVNDLALIARGIRFNRKAGLSDKEIYRYFVLPVAPELSREAFWHDIAEVALEKHP
jgi:hypothetical protein